MLTANYTKIAVKATSDVSGSLPRLQGYPWRPVDIHGEDVTANIKARWQLYPQITLPVYF